MKKQRVADKFDFPVEFVLLPQRRQKPEPTPLVPKPYEGYYQGYVRIVACEQAPEIVGLEVFMIAKDGRLPSCAPFYVYRCSKGITMNVEAVLSRARKGSAMEISFHTAPCVAMRLKDKLDALDMKYLLQEGELHLTNRALEMRIAAQCLSRARYPIASARIYAHVWWREHTSVGRLPAMALLNSAFVMPRKGQEGQKQRTRMDDLNLAQLEALKDAYLIQPWELVWYTVMKRHHGGVLPLTKMPYMEATISKHDVAMHIRVAVALLWKAEAEQSDTHNTLFSFCGLLAKVYRDLKPPGENRAEIEHAAREFALARDFRSLDTDTMALQQDHYNAQQTVHELQVVRARAFERSQRAFELRPANAKPTLPPRLTADQRRIAEHITQHWLTVVLGSPGTGKTAVITWLLSHYARAIASGFVGMLIKMLHRRNGRRPELAYTMDSFYYTHKRWGHAVSEWLATFEVLVIDECSNVGMRHLRRLLPLFSNLRKVVFVGDTFQCKSLEAGAMLDDLVAHFPQHTFRLTENLRVAPALKALHQAPGDIVTGNCLGLAWGPVLQSPLAHLPVPNGVGAMEHCLEQLYRKLLEMEPERGKLLLNSQILVLMHEGRWGRLEMNNAAQRVYERLGLLNPRDHQVVNIGDRVSVYPGCKITFNRNYNYPFDYTFPDSDLTVHSDPVANGEIVVVRRAKVLPYPGRGVLLEVADSHDPEAPSKSVWVARGNDGSVDPLDVDCGNCTTVYKVQGREFPFVFFCVPPNPSERWTRCNAYVAVSRAQERCVVLGNHRDFVTICTRPDVARRTVFRELLAQHPELAAHVPITANEPIVDDPAALGLLPADVRAVPTFAEFVAANTPDPDRGLEN